MEVDNAEKTDELFPAYKRNIPESFEVRFTAQSDWRFWETVAFYLGGVGAGLYVVSQFLQAQAGLIALQEDLDPVAGESRVKILLAENPRDPNLHFSLGNLYAAQERWPEAQRAYFDAYTLDSENPDFAFNLAVSLDRLGQGKPALAYYRRAAEIAAQRPAGFEPGVASRRIAVLETL